MSDVVTDLHLHSHYSRAVSPQMNLSVMSAVAKQKGLDILATGDWTHPVWFKELRSQLVEAEEGLYRISGQQSDQAKETRFLLSVEISCIYSQSGKGRRIHNLVFVPSFGTAEKVNKELLKRGCNLSSDGRPIIGLSSKNLLQLLLEIDERSLLIPAHVWTPWFGVYGQLSGFTSLSEAFEELAPYVYGIETGLSSDPEMNWSMKELETRSILSFSDAHSAPKMGREATVFRLEGLSYENIRKAIIQPSQKVISSDLLVQNKESTVDSEPITKNVENKILYTVEFYPEEGKYHYAGHRNCLVAMTPEDQRAQHSICPVCKRKVTDGVMRRVEELADRELRSNYEVKTKTKEKVGIHWIADPTGVHPPFVKLVPLLEIIAQSLSVPVSNPKAKLVFEGLCSRLNSELDILLKLPIAEIEKTARVLSTSEKAKKIAEGIQRVREARLVIQPGYDGVYGVVSIWSEDKNKKETKEQIGLEF